MLDEFVAKIPLRVKRPAEKLFEQNEKLLLWTEGKLWDLPKEAGKLKEVWEKAAYRHEENADRLRDEATHQDREARRLFKLVEKLDDMTRTQREAEKIAARPDSPTVMEPPIPPTDGSTTRMNTNGTVERRRETTPNFAIRMDKYREQQEKYERQQFFRGGRMS